MQVLERFGSYELHRLLGRGGSGEVYEATDTQRGRRVALKLLTADLADDPMYRARFMREARLAARLSDPHVVPIHDYGEVDGRLFIDMRLIEGPDLDQVLSAGPLPPARAVRILGQVAEALSAAHRAGMVHRDVKPSNVLLTVDAAGKDFAYLADFGIARGLGPDETGLTTSMVVGTLDFMSPEQLRGQAEARSDVYSLGCVLYRTLAGRLPYERDSLPAKITAHLHVPPPKLSEAAPWVGDHLDGVIVKAMAKNPNDRYRTAMEFAAVAQRAVEQRDFRLKDSRTRSLFRRRAAAPQGPFARTSDFGAKTISYDARRKARLAGVAIATAVVLLLGVGIAALSLSEPSQALPALVPPPPVAAPELVSTALPRQVSTLAVPGRPETVAISRDGSKAWMTTSDPAAPAVHLIDTATNTVAATIPLPGLPRFVVLNPVSDNVYVTYNDLAQNKLLVAGIDATQRRIVKTVETGQVAGRKTGQTWLFVAAMSKDGTRLYVPHHDRAVVSVIDTVTNTAVAQIGMPKNPHSVSLTPDGTKAFVTAHASGEVDVIDVASNTFEKSIPIGGGTSPHDVDVSPDGTRAHVVNFDAGTVSIVDVASRTVIATVAVGGKPQSVVFAPDGRRSYVVDNATNQLHTIDAVTNTITGTVPVAPGASMVALSPDGTRAWVSSRDSSLMTTFLTAS